MDITKRTLKVYITITQLITLKIHMNYLGAVGIKGANATVGLASPRAPVA